MLKQRWMGKPLWGIGRNAGLQDPETRETPAVPLVAVAEGFKSLHDLNPKFQLMEPV